MAFSNVENLQRESWEISSRENRLLALQNLEDGLAKQEGRESNTLRFFPGDVPINQRGLFVPEDGLVDGDFYSKGIYLNSKMVDTGESPYQATETVFHESRHSYQYHSALTENNNEDPGIVEDWAKSFKGGYVGYPQNDYSLYRFQPVENDANITARERTDELFQNQFNDPAYEPYKESRLAANQDQRDVAEIKYGPGFEEVARDRMIENYDASQKYQNQQSPKQDQSDLISESLRIDSQPQTQSTAPQVDAIPKGDDQNALLNPDIKQSGSTDQVRTSPETKELKPEVDRWREFDTAHLSPPEGSGQRTESSGGAQEDSRSS